MSDMLHVEALRAGSLFWNTWRRKNSDVAPDLNDLTVSVSERQFGRVQGGPIDLSRANLCRARLDQATLIEANLNGAVLVDADLSDARLEKADLRGANLRNVNLANATLDGAQLESAILYGADLRHARGLTQAQIDRAVGDRHTALPAGLTTPVGWLKEGPPPPPAHKSIDADIDDHRADPYAILRVRPGSSSEQIRAAWLKLVKELHSDAWASRELAATERLKVINQAYQRLKGPEHRQTQRRAARGFFGNARTVFVVFLLLPVLAGVLVIGINTYRSHLNIAASPAAGTHIFAGEQRQRGTPSSTSFAPSALPSSDEPSMGADWRLR
jgi:DnaJ-domain-containing protein 1